MTSRPVRWPRLRPTGLGPMVAALAFLSSSVLLGGLAGADGPAVRQDVPHVRLQIASYTSPVRAARFIDEHQLAWNECVLGKRLGVLPPGRTELPEICTAQTNVEVLRVQPARVRGITVYRVVTRPIPIDDLWGPLTAYRLAGFEPAVIK